MANLVATVLTTKLHTDSSLPDIQPGTFRQANAVVDPATGAIEEYAQLKSGPHGASQMDSEYGVSPGYQGVREHMEYIDMGKKT
jgi:hypothetical protein